MAVAELRGIRCNHLDARLETDADTLDTKRRCGECHRCDRTRGEEVPNGKGNEATDDEAALAAGTRHQREPRAAARSERRRPPVSPAAVC